MDLDKVFNKFAGREVTEESLKELQTAAAAAGFPIVRDLFPDQPRTMDYKLNRLNAVKEKDDKGVVRFSGHFTAG